MMQAIDDILVRAPMFSLHPERYVDTKSEKERKLVLVTLALYLSAQRDGFL